VEDEGNEVGGGVAADFDNGRLQPLKADVTAAEAEAEKAEGDDEEAAARVLDLHAVILLLPHQYHKNMQIKKTPKSAPMEPTHFCPAVPSPQQKPPRGGSAPQQY